MLRAAYAAGPRPWARYATLTVVVALSVQVSGALAPRPALAQAMSLQRTVPFGQPSVFGTPGIALHVPRDGRLNGDGFSAQVTGYRFVSQIGFGRLAKVAGKGNALLVFGLSGRGSAVTADLVVDGQSVPLPKANAAPSLPPTS